MQSLVTSQIFGVPQEWILPYEKGRAGDAVKKSFFEYALPRIVLGGFVSREALQRLIIEADVVRDGRGAAAAVTTLLRDRYLANKPNTKRLILGEEGERQARGIGIMLPLSPVKSVRQVLLLEERLLASLSRARARYNRLVKRVSLGAGVVRRENGSMGSQYALAMRS